MADKNENIIPEKDTSPDLPETPKQPSDTKKPSIFQFLKNINPPEQSQPQQDAEEKTGFFSKIKEFFNSIIFTIKSTIKKWFTPETVYNKDLHDIYSQNQSVETATLNKYIKNKEAGRHIIGHEIDAPTNEEVVDEEHTVDTDTVNTPNVSEPTETLDASESTETPNTSDATPHEDGAEEVSDAVQKAMLAAENQEKKEKKVVAISEGDPVENLVEDPVEDVVAISEDTPAENDVAEEVLTTNEEQIENTNPTTALLTKLNENHPDTFEYLFVSDKLRNDFILSENTFYDKELVLCGTTKEPDSIILINVDEAGCITNVAQLDGTRDIDQSFESVYELLKNQIQPVDLDSHQSDIFESLSTLGLNNIYNTLQQNSNLEKLFDKAFAKKEYQNYDELFSELDNLLKKENFAIRKDEVKDGILTYTVSHNTESIDYILSVSKDGSSFEITMNNDGEEKTISSPKQIESHSVRVIAETLSQQSTHISKHIQELSDDGKLNISDDLLKWAQSV